MIILLTAMLALGATAPVGDECDMYYHYWQGTVYWGANEPEAAYAVVTLWDDDDVMYTATLADSGDDYDFGPWATGCPSNLDLVCEFYDGTSFTPEVKVERDIDFPDDYVKIGNSFFHYKNFDFTTAQFP